MEKRDANRLEHPVLVAYRTVDRFLSDFGTNISRTGVFVNTREPLPVGTRVKLLVALPDQGEPCEIVGRVARVQPAGSGTAGMGIEFLGIDPETIRHIDALVDRLRRQLDQDPGQDKTA